MQPSNSRVLTTLPPNIRNLVSQKSSNVTGTWKKGLAFGFRDCDLWHGLDLKKLTTPKADTFKHPHEKDCFIRLSQQKSDKSKADKRTLKATYGPEFQKIRQIDKLSPDRVIKNFMDYDGFIHTAAQLIPEGKTIPECIFSQVACNQKNWPGNHAEMRNALSWLAQKMMTSEQDDRLLLLLAIWVELSNAMAIQRLGCSSLQGKAYFDWLEVFHYTRDSGLLASGNNASNDSEERTTSLAEGTTLSDASSDLSEEDNQPAATWKLSTFAALAASAKAIQESGTAIRLPVITFGVPGGGASIKTPAKTKASARKVTSLRTKSGRISKPKPALEIEFPAEKRRKPVRRPTIRRSGIPLSD